MQTRKIIMCTHHTNYQFWKTYSGDQKCQKPVHIMNACGQ